MHMSAPKRSTAGIWTHGLRVLVACSMGVMAASLTGWQPSHAASPTQDLGPGHDLGEAVRLLRRKQFIDSSRIFGWYVEKHPQELRVWRLLGDARMGQLQWGLALEAYDRALAGPASLPDEARILEQRGRAQRMVEVEAMHAAQAHRHPDLMSNDGATAQSEHLRVGLKLELAHEVNEARAIYQWWQAHGQSAAEVTARLARLDKVSGGEVALPPFTSAELTTPAAALKTRLDAASTMLADGHAASAVEVLRGVVGQMGDANQARHALARAALASGDLAMAAGQVATLRSCSSAKDKRVEVLRLSVEDEFNKLISSRPTVDKARMARDAGLALGRPQDARRMLDQLLIEQPTFVG
ncbi:MAG: hypothetical protein ACI9MC_002078, partial [Kiritimatiellia bacterium]